MDSPGSGERTERTWTSSALTAVVVACTTSPCATYRTGMTNWTGFAVGAKVSKDRAVFIEPTSMSYGLLAQLQVANTGPLRSWRERRPVSEGRWCDALGWAAARPLQRPSLGSWPAARSRAAEESKSGGLIAAPNDHLVPHPVTGAAICWGLARNPGAPAAYSCHVVEPDRSGDRRARHHRNRRGGCRASCSGNRRRQVFQVQGARADARNGAPPEVAAA